jgi:hypothetical protein
LRRRPVESRFTGEAADQVIDGDGRIESNGTTYYRPRQPMDAACSQVRQTETAEGCLQECGCRREERREVFVFWHG